MQTKKQMMIETLLNTFSGFIVSYAVTVAMLPIMDKIGAFYVTCLFTVISLVRSYVWRAIFNKKAKKA